MRYLIGQPEALQQWTRGHAGAPFSAERIGFTHALSQCILTDPLARDFPELMAMAHWFRKAHVLALQKQFDEVHTARQAAGTVFHITPGNVDTVFMYSWLLSLLLGNRNIIRLSQRSNPQMERLLAYLRESFAEYPALAGENLLLTYGHEDNITEELSRHCDRRVVWGGDATVAHIQSIALPAGAEDIGFPDRFSMAALEAAQVAGLEEKARDALFQAFYNDSLWFDQRACASPKLVVWVGEDAVIAKARAAFWTGFGAYVQRKGLPACATQTILRATIAMQWAANGWLAEEDAPIDTAQFPLHLRLEGLPAGLRETHPGVGMFGEVALGDIQDLAALTSEKEQCLSVFGFGEAALHSLKRSSHFRRIVPMGKALEFAVEWDGVNLFHALTRHTD